MYFAAVFVPTRTYTGHRPAGVTLALLRRLVTDRAHALLAAVAGSMDACGAASDEL